MTLNLLYAKPASTKYAANTFSPSHPVCRPLPCDIFAVSGPRFRCAKCIFNPHWFECHGVETGNCSQCYLTKMSELCRGHGIVNVQAETPASFEYKFYWDQKKKEIKHAAKDVKFETIVGGQKPESHFIFKCVILKAISKPFFFQHFIMYVFIQ